MSSLKEKLANCPKGATAFTDGKSVSFATNEQQARNYRSFGLKEVGPIANAPAEVEDKTNRGDQPLMSADVSAKEAVAMIQENDAQFLVGFISEGESRKSVLKAIEDKQSEPIQTVD